MKMHQASGQGKNLFTGYGPGHVLINGQRHDGNLIVSSDAIQSWAAADIASLGAEHFDALLALQPEVVLFGSGLNQRFVHPKLYAALTQAGIGFECMDTQAACRTFNILLAEDRRVVAALLAI
ncbi:Mth938-like domain-containing protein [Chromobacterium sp. IIBBL 290-4]|uniref:Mth938-like domain-containing protein n=1 Tax=Chromobacterium sp. IIBBL 290-4 TaxID=2953890 RepID=UPI0020B6E184|nr:Mth938-like domain-containing protein [Chromobacterium sp. IIBBL 290-4]UTH75066.1 Mth938-like domain-containing protein [Chromobacterium sp. IIBBL 290-4]